MTRVITIACPKGGSGKSTLTQSLAVAAQTVGQSAVIVDLDPQVDTGAWNVERERNRPNSSFPLFAATEARDIRRDMKEARNMGADYVLVDTPPVYQGTGHLGGIYKASDIVLVPVQPSPKDLRAALSLHEILATQNVPHSMVLTGHQSRTVIGREIDQYLQTHEVPVMPTALEKRIAYAAAAISGRTPLDYEPDGKAATEILDLWADVQMLLQ